MSDFHLWGQRGAGTTFDDICRYAGINNAASIAGISANGTMTKEQIVQTNPDFFLLPTWDYSGKLDLGLYKQEVLNDPALQSVKAIQERRLYQVPDKYLMVVHDIRMAAKFCSLRTGRLKRAISAGNARKSCMRSS